MTNRYTFPQYDNLTYEQECALSVKIQQGDEKARERLVMCNLGFAIDMATKFANYPVDIEDLKQEAVIGMWDAASRFVKDDSGATFTSYARWWIMAYLQAFVSEFAQGVRIPRTAWVAASQSRGGREGAAIGQTSAATIAAAQAISRGHLSLDAPVSDTDGEKTVSETVGILDDPSDDMQELGLISEVADVMDSLPDRHAYIVREYFGIGKMGRRSLQDIGDEMGVSRERTRQIKQEALEAMRANLDGRYSAIWEYADDLLESGAKVNVPIDIKLARRVKHKESGLGGNADAVTFDDANGMPRCPKCGGESRVSGYRSRADGGYRRYRCESCMQHGVGALKMEVAT